MKLVQSRRPFMLNTRFATDSKTAATAFQTLIAMTDREHMACLFLNANHEITGAHIIAVGAQSRIGAGAPRVIFRAAFMPVPTGSCSDIMAAACRQTMAARDPFSPLA